MEVLSLKVDSLMRVFDKESGRLDQLQIRRTELSKEIDSYQSDQLILQKTYEALKSLMEAMSEDNIVKVQDLVTFGINSIFGERYKDLKFTIESSTKRDQLFYEFLLEVDGVKAPLDGSFGGGMICVISLILRILISVNLGLYPFILLDESLNGVSPEFQQRTAEFLQTIAEQLSVDILLVSHQEQFTMGANKRYRCYKNEIENRLVMTEVR